MSSIVRKMRAHRMVLEQNCSICNAGFTLAEEVYQCSVCGGYHHVACWDAKGTCVPGAAPVTSYSPPSVTDPGTQAPVAQTVYSAWSVQALEDALTTERGSYQPDALSLMEAELKSRGGPPLKPCSFCQNVNKASVTFCTQCGRYIAAVPSPFASANVAPTAPIPTAPAAPGPAAPGPSPAAPTPPQTAPDERRCPSCAEMIKKEAVKCRFCGHVLDSRYGVQSPGGFFSDTSKRLAEDEIRSEAKNAMILSIVGIFCFGFILGPVALYKASRVFKQISAAESEYGSVEIGSARGQAIAAVIIGIVVLLLTALYVIGSVSNGGRR